MRDKWHIKNNNKKGYLKIHIAVNIKTKKILAMMKVTDDEHIYDSKMLPVLVDDVIKPGRMISIGKLIADGAHEANEIFRYLGDKGIQPCIKVRKNARIKLKTAHILRNLSVLAKK